MHDKFQMIQQLMEELQEEMEYTPEDLEGRLGRGKKPDGGVAIIEVKKTEGDEEMEMPPATEDHMMEEPLDEEESLKQRLMRLRG